MDWKPGGMEMIKSLKDTVTLNNGVTMPGFGFGVYKLENGRETAEMVKTAIQYSYRLIDTAALYENEEGVGEGIRESGVPREEVFVTTKLWNDQHGYDNALKAFDESLKKLNMDYVDLYLIHWPVTGKFIETWKALEKLYDEGLVRAIGVSNFHIHHLESLFADANVKPAVNQVEYHPHLTQENLRAFCQKENIQMEAWSPLKKGRLLDHPLLLDIGKKYGKSPAQVILRWTVQNSVIPIPKSSKPERIRENAAIFDFSLTDGEMKEISALNLNERSGPDPDTFV